MNSYIPMKTTFLLILLCGCTKAIQYEPVDQLEPTNLESASLELIHLFDKWRAKAAIYQCDDGAYEVIMNETHKQEFDSLAKARMGAEIWALEMAELEIKAHSPVITIKPCGRRIE